MAFSPKDLPSENINVTPRHPLNEFFWLLGGLAGLIVVVYFVLGLAVDWVVPYVPPRTEANLGKLFSSIYQDAEQGPKQLELQNLIHQLSQPIMTEGQQDYHVHIISNGDMVNAMALPGGSIVVYSELLKQAKSENELAFVLAHEIGHLYKRHSLKRLGRSLVLLTLSDILLGQSNVLSGSVSTGIDGLQKSFSRAQETSADEMGLKLVKAHYGHAGGVTDFFQRLSEQQTAHLSGAYFSTHPQPLKRVAHLKSLIKEQQLPVQPTISYHYP